MEEGGLGKKVEVGVEEALVPWKRQKGKMGKKKKMGRKKKWAKRKVGQKEKMGEMGRKGGM